jgi:hypothetical protein
MSYEHPSHKADRERRAVAPVLDIAGWTAKPKILESLDGQQALPGLEAVERERAYRGRRDEGRGQTHLF